MSKICIKPTFLRGDVLVPPSKSVSHRALISAALSHGQSKIHRLLDCEDTRATIDILRALGAEIQTENEVTTVNGIQKSPEKAELFCRESGSTLRFLLPVAAALGVNARIFGEGQLPNRPLIPYFTELKKNGIMFVKDKMPYEIYGQLQAGEFCLAGDISSQFVSGLMFALPLLDGDSVVKITSPLQSKPYVDITVDVLKHFGIEISECKNEYLIRGNQRFLPCDFTVEADMSQAAFFLVANALGGKTNPLGINRSSIQGDAAIVDVVKYSDGKGFEIDAAQIPDLVPILTVLAALSDGSTKIFNCGRLRIKECDRLSAVATELNRLGARVHEGKDFLEVEGVQALSGGECDSHNDHRIAMSLAIASQKCTAPLTINGAECVAKSYPHFFDDFAKLGGKFDVING